MNCSNVYILITKCYSFYPLIGSWVPLITSAMLLCRFTHEIYRLDNSAMKNISLKIIQLGDNFKVERDYRCLDHSLIFHMFTFEKP